jgi:hypothetical protein
MKFANGVGWLTEHYGEKGCRVLSVRQLTANGNHASQKPLTSVLLGSAFGRLRNSQI